MAHQLHQNTYTRILVTVAVGFLLFQVLVVDLLGILAAIAIPREYFLWFGKGRQELAHAFLQLASAFLVFVLVCGGVLATKYVNKARASIVLVAFFIGMLLCFLYWTVWSLFGPIDLPSGVEPFPLETRLKHIFFLPWWAYPVQLAPWIGFGFAAWLVLRKNKR